jgi:hypothetical protein
MGKPASWEIRGRMGHLASQANPGSQERTSLPMEEPVEQVAQAAPAAPTAPAARAEEAREARLAWPLAVSFGAQIMFWM